MQRVVVLGPGAAGKSTFARSLGTATGLPVIELDQRFWTATLEPTPPERWHAVQADLAQSERWIMDGDLGPYDDPAVRVRAADTIVLLDLPTIVCVWRALRRSHERADFWRWLLTWRRRYRPALMRLIARDASQAELIIVRRAREIEGLLEELARR